MKSFLSPSYLNTQLCSSSNVIEALRVVIEHGSTLLQVSSVPAPVEHIKDDADASIILSHLANISAGGAEQSTTSKHVKGDNHNLETETSGAPGATPGKLKRSHSVKEGGNSSRGGSGSRRGHRVSGDSNAAATSSSSPPQSSLPPTSPPPSNANTKEGGSVDDLSPSSPLSPQSPSSDWESNSPTSDSSKVDARLFFRMVRSITDVDRDFALSRALLNSYFEPILFSSSTPPLPKGP
jgi:hypothetical protein